MRQHYSPIGHSMSQIPSSQSYEMFELISSSADDGEHSGLDRMRKYMAFLCP